MKVSMKKYITWQTKTGNAIEINDVTIIPQAQVLQLKLPFGGLLWNRPTNVMVERNGQIKTFPLIDVTRFALWVIFGLTAVIYLLLLMRNRR